MEEEMITIAKKPGVKDCVRISSVNDIPDFLKEVVRIEGENLVLDCLEGEERCPLGSVIAFEKLESGKMNVWNKFVLILEIKLQNTLLKKYIRELKMQPA